MASQRGIHFKFISDEASSLFLSFSLLPLSCGSYYSTNSRRARARGPREDRPSIARIFRIHRASSVVPLLQGNLCVSTPRENAGFEAGILNRQRLVG